MRSLLLSVFLFGTVLFGAGCSDANTPPVLGDPMSMPTEMVQQNEGGAPCSTPSQGCPCTTPGEQVYCGVIYRISGSRVDCSKGYVTCQDDGKYSACEGARIFGQ